MMWKTLGKNSAWTLLAAFILSGAEIFSGYESSKVNDSLENLTTNMIKNSEKIDQTQRDMLKLQGEVYKNFDNSQKQMMTLQSRLYDRVFEQDKVIYQIRRDTVHMERENIIRREYLNKNK